MTQVRDLPVSAALSPELVRDALARSQPGERLNWLASHLGLAVEALIPEAAAYFGLDPVAMEELRTLRPDFSLISFAECQRRQMMAGYWPDGGLTVVLCDPTDQRLAVWLETRLGAAARGRVWKPGLAARADLQAFLARVEKQLRAMDSVQLQAGGTSGSGGTDLDLSIAHIDSEASPVVRLVDSTLHDALLTGASDIHLETQATGLIVKYRIDGVLEVVKQVDSPDIADQAISRIKVLAELDISERRVPQDGRFRVVTDGREIDFRVSIMPNLFGEDAVLRVLDRQHLTGQMRSLTLDTLGFEPEVLEFIRRISQLPYGMLLVTGPTGSGKTTTLYGALSEINTGLDKIITIEDPIEYQLPGVLQIPVNERKGLTFARGLRSILRHDPDKIMVGEIRDAETANIAVQAALTGHQVFTTVHANNVFDVIGRFHNMGVDGYSLVAALNGIVAQRLVRLNCPACTTGTTPSETLVRDSGISPRQAEVARWRRGLGCAHCRGSGYKGRRAIAETLPLNDSLRELMVQRASLAQIRSAARASGFVSLRQAAVEMAVEGTTTLEEINRVTPVEASD